MEELLDACRLVACEAENDGSAQLVNTLLAADLIDRYQLMIFPVTLGAGKRLFHTDDELKAFRLTDTATTSTGVAVLTYELD
jgi:dihydrofolate reductase